MPSPRRKLNTDSLREVFAKRDLPHFERWLPTYAKLFDVVHELRPRIIVEIGVRCGYSAWIMAQAAPGALILGYDLDGDEREVNTHMGFRGACIHAVEIMRSCDFHLTIVDSHQLLRLPRCDLVYVDGDHTEAGCYADLCLADQAADVILVDDYDTPFEGGAKHVRRAVDRFIETYGYTSVYHDNGSTGLMLIDKRDRW